MQQAPAKISKAPHNTKAKLSRSLLDETRGPPSEWRQAGGFAERALIMRTYGTLPKHQTKHRRNGNDPNRLYFS
jgi:hypothetical protein